MRDESTLGELWLAETITIWRRNKETADRAIAQLDEAQMRRAIDPEVNSVAAVMKHVAGNLRSRWGDFLTADGEKPDRNRDDEFVDDYPDREAMLADWLKERRFNLLLLGSFAVLALFREISGSVYQGIRRGILTKV